MSLLGDLKVLRHLAFNPIRGGSHRERLESFYKGQAGDYDDFRRRLLKGREALYRRLVQTARPGAVWVDMGGGTGANLEAIAGRVPSLGRVYIVDLSTSLLEVARRRVESHGWTNVEVVEADVTTFQPPGAMADVVTFSYSLTMIPDWFLAIDQAHSILRPGGHLGVVDFHTSRKHPQQPVPRHSWFTRTFWPAWFAGDNVFLNPDHIPYITSRFRPIRFSASRGRVPYMMGMKVPYYQLIGRKDAPGA